MLIIVIASVFTFLENDIVIVIPVETGFIDVARFQLVACKREDMFAVNIIV